MWSLARSIVAASYPRHLVAFGSPAPLRTRLSSIASAGRACFVAPTDEDTRWIAAELAKDRRAGDCVCLSGAVGAGKSCFSRHYIRSIEEDDTLPVPSPTYLLQNIYDFEEGPPVHHFDLYRLAGPADLPRLDLPSSFASAVTLIEWPDRLGDAAPIERLDVRIYITSLAQQQCILDHIPNLVPEWSPETVEAEGEEAYQDGDTRFRVLCLEAHGDRWQAAVSALERRSSECPANVRLLPRTLADSLQMPID